MRGKVRQHPARIIEKSDTSPLDNTCRGGILITESEKD